MPERVNFPITFEKGLFEEQEESVLDTGYLSLLENWVPEASGALRARRRWASGSTTGAPSTRRTRGIGSLALQSTFATPTLRQKGWNKTASNSAIQGTWPLTTVAGNLLVALVSADGSGGPVPNITPPAGWTLAAERSFSSQRLAMYYIANAASQTTTGTFTSSDTGMMIQHFEFSGITATAPLDQAASAQGSSTAAASGTTGTTTQAIELVIAGLGAFNADFSAPTNGFVLEETTYNPLSMAGLYKVLSATGTTNTGATLSISNSWGGVIATFKAAAVALTGGRYLVAHDDGANFDIFAIDRDALSSATWTEIDSNRAAADRSVPVAFADGLGSVLYTHKDFTVTRRWDGASAVDVTAAPRGRTLCFYRNRFFIGGTKGGAFGNNGSTSNVARLWYSDLGSYTVWNNNNFIDVNQDDGEPIEDIAPVSDGLLIAKRSSLWFLSGTGPDNFHLTQLEDGEGYPGRCIAVGPFGAMVTGMHHVWLWAGGRPEPMSHPVDGTYEIGGAFVTTGVIGHLTWICDSGSGVVWVHDHMGHRWWIEKLASDQPAYIAAFEGTLLFGPLASTTFGPLAYRDEPRGARGRDVGMATNFKAETPELYPGGAGRTITPRHLYLELRQRGGDASDAGLKVTPIYDGVEQTQRTIAPKATAKPFTHRLDIGSLAGIKGVKFRFQQDNTAADDAIMDIERVEFIGLVSPHR